MTDHLEAATSLVKFLKAPPQAHSVWIKTETDTETKEFKKSLCVSVRPEWQSRINVPANHLGFPVELVPWPMDQL